MRLQKCCCCISIQHGVIAIGVLNLLDALFAALQIDLFGLALKGFTAVWFAFMFLKDSKLRRLYFFVSFVTQITITYIVEAYIFYTILSSNKFAKEVCRNVEKENGFPNDEYQTIQDCYKGIEGDMEQTVALWIIFQMIVHFHFGLVLFTHWRNADLSVKEGGLVPMASEVQMQAPSVDHAVDDESLDRPETENTTEDTTEV